MELKPIETAPKDGTEIIGYLVVRSLVRRVFDMRHNGLAWYTINGHRVPEPTHWTHLPEPPTVSACKEARQSRRTQHELPIPEPPDLPSIEEVSGSIHPDCEIFETRTERENA